MNEQGKTVHEWLKEYDSRMLSADGFRDSQDWSVVKLSRAEFLKRARICTLVMSPEIVKAFDEMSK